MNIKYNFPSNLMVKVSDIITPPIVITINEFNESSYSLFCKDFDAALNSNQTIIPVNIDSYGGEAYSLLGMVNILKASEKPVYTYISTKGMSCGAILFTCGVKRYMAPYSTLLIHDVSTGIRGKVSEAIADANEAKRLDNLVYELMDANTKHKKGFFKSQVHNRNHADWYITAAEAKQMNLATHIGTPTLYVDVDINYSII